MSFNINKAKESFGIFAPVEFNNSAAIKQFSGAFSIGTSKRAPLFIADEYLPGPGAYHFKDHINSLPKWSFSTSQRSTFTSNKNPPPVAYTTSSSIGKNSPLYSFGTKPIVKTEKDNLGPGSYNPSLQPTKSFPTFSFGYKPLQNMVNITPGPGTYHKDKSLLSNKDEAQKKEKKLPRIKSESGLNPKKHSIENTKKKKNYTNTTSLYKDKGFSTSNRDDFYNKEFYKVPGPGSYDLNYRASYTEGPSHKFIYGPKGFFNKVSQDPGPGQYFSESSQKFNSMSPQITISGKYKNVNDENISARYNPGPGAYNPKFVDKIPDIKFQKSSKNTNFSNENPGPGYYDVENTLNKNFQGIGFSTGQRTNISKDTSEPGPGHYDIILKNQGPKMPILGRHENPQSIDKITPGPGKYDIEFLDSKNQKKTTGSMMSQTKKGNTYIKEDFTPGPGKYNLDSSVDDSGPKYTFGTSIKKKTWKKLYEPGPGAYDIPSTIAGIPNYLLNNTTQPFLKISENSKYSEYIKEINESIRQNDEYA